MHYSIVFALICSLGWGVSTWFDKKATNVFTGNTTFVIRSFLYVLVGLVFYAFTAKDVRREVGMITNSQKHQQAFYYLFIGAMLAGFCGTAFYYKAMAASNGNTPQIIALVHALPIVIAFMLVHLYSNERITVRQLIAMGLIIGGLFLMNK